MNRTVIAAVLGLVASTSVASAHDWYGGSNIDRRQDRQEFRQDRRGDRRDLRRENRRDRRD